MGRAAYVAAFALPPIAATGAGPGSGTVELFGQTVTIYFAVLAAFAVIVLGATLSALVSRRREVENRVRAEAALSESEERYRGLVDRMPDAVLVADAEGRFTFANPRACELVGFKLDELLEMTYADLMAPSHVQRVAEHVAHTVSAGTDDPFESEMVTASDRVVPVELTMTLLHGKNGRSASIQWIARDITERKRFESELVHLANHDSLTGLHNRRWFESELRQELERARRSGRGGAVVWLDIDHFKEINDSLGHRVGDDIIVGVSAAVQQATRAGNTVARLGGDEFGILDPDASAFDAECLAERLVERIRQSVFTIDGKDIRVTPSVGVVVYPQHGDSAEELLTRADLAMYHAKEEGRNRYCFYRPDEQWDAQMRSRLTWVMAIEQALRENRFVVHAQPIVDLATGEVDRYELLVRMEADDGSIIAPDLFLPVAERVGLIPQIDRWMVQHAIDLLALQNPWGPATRLDVNVSGRAFSDPGLLELISDELMRTGVEPSRFGIEITETAAVEDVSRARTFVEALKRIGCRVALDDFGSGYSSIYYLNNLPVDCVKIDGGFVKSLRDSRKDQHIVRAIVELSKGFGIVSTAEFIEDAETLELLREYGVHYGQGFYIGMPTPEAEMLSLAQPLEPGREVRDISRPLLGGEGYPAPELASGS
jgi:diguanylate cyclase (GGDEF)-like protein/PAS domain S-box-containing protein